MNNEQYTFDEPGWIKQVGDIHPMAHDWGTARNVWYPPSTIVGPWDAACVSYCRNRIAAAGAISVSKYAPTDQFILAKGEPIRLGGTKFGGMPDVDGDFEWPVNGGAPCDFLAQFDFTESKDIVPHLPSDYLLVFGSRDLHVQPTCMFINKPTRRMNRHKAPAAIRPLKAFAGHRWRTKSYVEWSFSNPDDESEGNAVLGGGDVIWNAWHVANLLGLQIGSHPYCEPNWDVGRGGMRIVCSFCSVVPTTDVPYPFINQSRPIDETNLKLESEDLYEVKGGLQGVGIVYIVIAPDAVVQARTVGLY